MVTKTKLTEQERKDIFANDKHLRFLTERLDAAAERLENADPTTDLTVLKQQVEITLRLWNMYVNDKNKRLDNGHLV